MSMEHIKVSANFRKASITFLNNTYELSELLIIKLAPSRQLTQIKNNEKMHMN